MKYVEPLQKVLDYMEENLYEDMDLDGLASIAVIIKFLILFHRNP